MRSVAAGLLLASLLIGSLVLRVNLAPWALALGIGFGLAVGAPAWKLRAKASKICLQVAVVLLGFQVSLSQVIATGSDGLVLAILSIATVLAVGLWVGTRLGMSRRVAWLVAGGTAICGGSAIAALATALDAEEGEVAVAAGTVFLLNAVAMFALPGIGLALGVTPHAFGIWAGVSIHDVASVAGAASTFGDAAVSAAMTVKLSRVLYLVPVVLLVASIERKPGQKWQQAMPWFVFGFLATASLRSALPQVADLAPLIKPVANLLFSTSLFLIGLGVSRTQLKAIGPRPFGLGLGLWILLCVAGYLAALR